MRRHRKGSWSVLIATMALLYAAIKTVGRRAPAIIAPLTVFIRFITDRYEAEIDAIGKWIRKQFEALLNWSRRRFKHAS